MSGKSIRREWWQLPKIWAGVVAGVIALGMSIRYANTYIELPERVEAGEVYDAAQDERFQEYLQAQHDAIIQQQATEKILREVFEQQAQQLPQQRSYPNQVVQPQQPEYWFLGYDDDYNGWCTDGYDEWVCE